MVHFDFVVDDVDAEHIMQGIRELANRCDDEILKCMSDNDVDAETKANYIAWFKRHKKYLLNLQEQMKNTRVKE